MKNQDWKLKYRDLKLKFLDCVDTSFRLGYEAGAQGAQLQQAQQDQAAEQAAAAQPGMPGQDPNAQPGMPGQDGSELDQHIGTLEGMLGQAKPGSPEQAGLQKSLNGIKAFQLTLKKSANDKMISDIGKAMKPKFTLGKSATKNLSESGKKALNMQEQIVADLMKSMDDEQAKAATAITKTLDFEQLLKG